MGPVKNKNIAPAITLIFLAPLITEILPGATRFSSLFVFPIQICVWGGGALRPKAAIGLEKYALFGACIIRC
ncbi:MAG: hypothetical protein ABI184_04760 [Ginsengibacter sp.]